MIVRSFARFLDETGLVHVRCKNRLGLRTPSGTGQAEKMKEAANRDGFVTLPYSGLISSSIGLLQIIANSLPRLGHVFEHDPMLGIAGAPRHLSALRDFGVTFFNSEAFTVGHFYAECSHRLDVPGGTAGGLAGVRSGVKVVNRLDRPEGGLRKDTLKKGNASSPS